MSINNTSTRRAGPFPTNGVTVDFPFEFKVFESEDLVVTSSEDGVDTVLVIDVDYTVELNADQEDDPGGTVTLVEAPDGPSITVTSGMAETQPTVFTNSGGFFPRVLNNSLDRLTILVQQVTEKLTRALVAPHDSSQIVGYYPVVLADGTFGYATGTGSDADLRADLAAITPQAGATMVSFAPGGTVQQAITYVTPQMYGATGDGVTDDVAAFTSMAAAVANGGYVSVPAGTYRLGAPGVVFPQDDLKFVSDPGAVFLQDDNTEETLDTLMSFTGDRSYIQGGTWDGNEANNPDPVEGRGELLRIEGTYNTVIDATFQNIRDVDFGCGIYNYATHSVLRNITMHNSGRSGIRDQGDYTVIDGLRIFDMRNDNGVVGCKGISHGDTPSGSAFTRLDYRNLYFHSDQVEWFEGIVVDHDATQGGDVFVDGITLDFPNLISTAGDVIKFVFCDSVSIRGLRANHPATGSINCTLRFQEGIARVVLDDCVFPGSVNFDATVSCDLHVKGGTVFGDTISIGAAVEDFRGNAVFEDGTRFKNITTQAVYTSSDTVTYDPISEAAMASTITFGRCHFHGASGTPYLVRFVPLFISGTKRRSVAGAITADKPLSVTGTFKNLETNGVWGTFGEAPEASFAQDGPRKFLVASAWPPNEIEGYKLGDIIRKRNPAASDAIAYYFCTQKGAACTTAWAPSTAYTKGQWRTNGSAPVKVYACTTAGTSAGSGGPTTTGSGITDGTAVWDYVDQLAVFKGVGSVAA